MKKFLLPLSILSILALVGCAPTTTSSDISSSSQTQASEDPDVEGDVSEIESTSIDVPDYSSTLNIETSKGTYTEADGLITITGAGTYTLSGTFEGTILVNAGDDDEVTLELNGVSLSSSSDSPIKVTNCDSVKIKAMENTVNVIKDLRAAETDNDSDDLGKGAITSSVDTSFVGKGTLVIEANYNNGIHVTKDLSIKNETMQIVALNNAIKGNNSVEIESGTFELTTKEGDGIKTEDTDVSKKGKQRGIITITGGTFKIDAANGGIDAAYSAVINETSTDVLMNIFTGTYSTYGNTTTASSGIKAEEEILISDGEFLIKSSADDIHTNYGTVLDNGSISQGNININGGNLTLYSKDDGIHADNTLNITGGNLHVVTAYEGIEANFINISGGTNVIYATDDGVNASNKTYQTPNINITGGYLDVTVASGDCDGIDSNGTYTQSGGIVITRGPSSSNENMSGIDADRTVSVTGGTLVVLGSLGHQQPSTMGNNLFKAQFGSSSQGQGGGHGGRGGQGGEGGNSSSYSFAKGDYSLALDSTSVIFDLEITFNQLTIFTTDMTLNNSYTLKKDGSDLLTWKQSSQTYTA